MGMEKYIFTEALGLYVSLVDVLWRSRGTAESGEVTDPLFAMFECLVRSVAITLNNSFPTAHPHRTLISSTPFNKARWSLKDHKLPH